MWFKFKFKIQMNYKTDFHKDGNLNARKRECEEQNYQSVVEVVENV